MSCRRGGSPSRAVLSDLSETMTGLGLRLLDTPAIWTWRQTADGTQASAEGRGTDSGVPLRRSIDGAWRRQGGSRSWQVARSSGSTPTGATASSDPSRARMCSCTQRGAGQRAADLAGGPGRRVRHRAGTKGTAGRQRAGTVGTCWDDAPLLPAAGVADSTDVASILPPADATRAGRRLWRLGVIADDLRGTGIGAGRW
jgi:hypothetical protein